MGIDLDLPLAVRESLYDLGGTVIEEFTRGMHRVQVWRVQKGLMLAYIWTRPSATRVSFELFTGPATVCIDELLKDVAERTK